MILENYLLHDIVYEISHYLNRKELFNFLSTCQYTYGFTDIFYNKYTINLKKLKKKLNNYGGDHNKNLSLFEQILKKTKKISEVTTTNIFEHAINVIDVSFGWYFIGPITNLPSSVRFISFKGLYDSPIDDFHDSIISITFDSSSFFNQPLTKLPQIKDLTLGKFFNQPIDQLVKNISLCKSLNHLTIYRNKHCKININYYFNTPPVIIHHKSTYKKINSYSSLKDKLTGENINLKINFI